MQNFVNRYVVWVLLAIGLHVLLLMTWASNYQPVQLRLQSGHQTVSLQFSPSAVSQTSETLQEKSGGADVAQTPPTSDVKTDTLAELASKDLKTVPIQTSQLTPDKKKGLERTQVKSLDVRETNTKILPVNAVVNERSDIISKKQPPDIPVTPLVVTKDADSAPDKDPSSMSEVQASRVLAIAQPMTANNPKYPRRAIIRNQQGRVTVKFLVDKFGYVENIELVESSGYALLDESVLRFAEQEQFLPATQDGNPIASTQSFLFRFVLE